LDRQTKELLEQLASMAAANDAPAQVKPDISIVRQAAHAIWLAYAGVADPDCDVRELSIAGPAGAIPARLYRPPGIDKPTPLVVFLHGGGWSLGDLDSYDGLMRSLAVGSGTRMLSVDYRLAPEHKYPAGLEDAESAVEWAIAHAVELGAKPQCVAVMGDSAGGNLATVVAHRLHSRTSRRLAAQFLLYPVIDVSQPHATYRSRITMGDGEYLLTRDGIDDSVRWYLDGATRSDDPSISPQCLQRLDILPPTLIITAGFDPLRDEAEAYAERLRVAGVPTHVECFESAIHAFLSFGVLDLAQSARRYLANEIRCLMSC
jgi:acetyl esterase